MKPPLAQKVDTRNWPSWLSTLQNGWDQTQRYLQTVFSKNITFSENILCQLKQLTVTTSATYGTAPVLDNFTPIVYQSTLKSPATAIMLATIRRIDNAPLAGAVTLCARDDNGNIRIDYITGLEPSVSYAFTVLSF